MDYGDKPAAAKRSLLTPPRWSLFAPPLTVSVDSAEFDRLVGFTRQAFGPRHQPEWNETPAETRARVYRKVLPERGRGEFLSRLMDESAESKQAWDSVKLIAESLLRYGERLPAELSRWLADVLADQGKPKTEQRGRGRPRGAHPTLTAIG